MSRQFLVLLLLALPAPSAAQDSLSPACDHARTASEVRRCASLAVDDATRHLERYLQEARRLAKNRALLDSAQAAWEHYRDLACRAAGSRYERDTEKPVVVLNCLATLTRHRVRELFDHYLRMSRTHLPEPKL